MAAGAIIRVSTAKQLEGTSPEKQVEGIRALAFSQGFEVSEEAAWLVAESGAMKDRTGFRRALDAAGGGRVERVYVYSVDRLGRNLLEMLLFLRDLSDLGLECWEAEKRRPLVWDDFLFQVEGAVAGKERQEILKRTQDGLRRAIRAGKYSGGIVAYGYRIEPESKRLVVDEDEAAVVRSMFAWCADEGLSCVEIADRLNGLGIPTRYAKDGRLVRQRGKRDAAHTAGIWRAGRVRNMLRNPAYVGRWEWGKRSSKRRAGDRIAGECPALVSSATAHRAARVLAGNRWVMRRPERRQYLVRGLIRCAHCGRAYVGAASHVASGDRRYYRCNGSASWRKLGIDRCEAKSIRADQLEDVVWGDIVRFVTDPQVAVEHLRAQRAAADDSLPEKLREADGRTEELKRQERNLIRLAAESDQADPQALDDVLSEIRGSLAALTAYTAALETRREAGEALERELFGLPERLARLRSRVEGATFEERRRAVLELVKSVEVATEMVAGQKTAVVTITYRFGDPGEPIPPVPDDSVLQDSTGGREGVQYGGLELQRKWEGQRPSLESITRPGP